MGFAVFSRDFTFPCFERLMDSWGGPVSWHHKTAKRNYTMKANVMDPIFAAIETKRIAWAAYTAEHKRGDELRAAATASDAASEPLCTIATDARWAVIGTADDGLGARGEAGFPSPTFSTGEKKQARSMRG
jgi:hypothetical protein